MVPKYTNFQNLHNKPLCQSQIKINIMERRGFEPLYNTVKVYRLTAWLPHPLPSTGIEPVTYDLKGHRSTSWANWVFMPTERIELSTPRFSVECSTIELR